MKKLSLLFASALAVVGLTLAPADNVHAQGKTTIGVAFPQDDNPFYIAMLRGVRARAQELGWEVVAVSSNEDKLKQINGVQDLVARGVKGILISPIDATGVNAAYDAAAAGKVPIVSVARGSTSPNQTLHVAMDEKQIGRDIAEWTAKQVGGKGKVAMLLGPSGAPTFRNLAEGYTEVMSKYPDISIAFRTDGPLTRERGLKNAEDALVAHPDLVAIYTANDDVALGATQAVLAANRKGKTLVTGMNGVPPALRSLKEGNLGMTIELNPVLWGRMGVDVLSEYLKGSKVEPRVFISTSSSTRTTSTRSFRRTEPRQVWRAIGPSHRSIVQHAATPRPPDFLRRRSHGACSRRNWRRHPLRSRGGTGAIASALGPLQAHHTDAAASGRHAVSLEMAGDGRIPAPCSRRSAD
jgi:ribose transport system substrate-binding protein